MYIIERNVGIFRTLYDETFSETGMAGNKVSNHIM
jgi:hypothetical protein